MVFRDYVKSMTEISTKFPDFTVIHFTVPLKAQRKDWKAYVKKIIGRDDPWGNKDNVKRNEYNAKLVEKYEGKEPIFDIAKIQSTYPDGSRRTFNENDQTYYAMVPEYTYDGGHLNELGRRVVAEKLLLLLIKQL